LNSKQKLIGVISQGDILRTLIDGVNPYSQIDSLLNPDFIYLNERDMKKAYKIMKEKGFTLLPVVDSEFHLTDIITIADVFRYIDSELSWEC
jgi:CBS domain-containing protein